MRFIKFTVMTAAAIPSDAGSRRDRAVIAIVAVPLVTMPLPALQIVDSAAARAASRGIPITVQVAAGSSHLDAEP